MMNTSLSSVRRAAFGLISASSFFAATASAKTCELSIEGNDAMQYNQKELTVEKTCTDVKVTLKHAGKLPKSAMGHNWVLTNEKDMQAMVAAGMQAGLNGDYVAKDPKVIAATKLVGGGETTTATFKFADLKAGETYKYFCSFPGHSAVMSGVLVVK